jgi:hypothetical protein
MLAPPEADKCKGLHYLKNELVRRTQCPEGRGTPTQHVQVAYWQAAGGCFMGGSAVRGMSPGNSFGNSIISLILILRLRDDLDCRSQATIDRSFSEEEAVDDRAVELSRIVSPLRRSSVLADAELSALADQYVVAEQK